MVNNKFQMKIIHAHTISQIPNFVKCFILFALKTIQTGKTDLIQNSSFHFCESKEETRFLEEIVTNEIK